MVLDLLVYSRVGRMQEVETINLESAFNDARSTLTIPRECRITHEFKANSLTIGVRDIITLLQSLLSNAIIHGSDPIGDIKVASHQQDAMIVICVTDSGQGIDEKYNNKIFEMMSTLRSRDEQEGSGMGLATAAKICKKYGGEIMVQTNPNGQGSQFVVQLPT